MAALQGGAVGILPTDTIFGVVARAADKQAVAKLYSVKHREGKPGTMIAASIEQLVDLGLDKTQLGRVSHLWPNSVSIVLPAGAELAYLHQGKSSLAVRIPSDPEIHALLEQTGPLLTSSANMPGEPSSNNVAEAVAYFGDSVDFYVEGDTSANQASTVAMLHPDGTIETLRQGAVVIEGGK
ncbi:MAG TPA: L-threonylcarbamoyladenylate synthase [Candidatus Saccharimonadales bacterium]|nr:L-threonylcarbamoyladenylate synthase [Candidatus Saccharimonadales bacterium]